LLVRQARRRCGPTLAEQAEPLRDTLCDPDLLEALGEEFLICPDGESWLATLSEAQPVAER
jgi:hypothetical protein